MTTALRCTLVATLLSAIVGREALAQRGRDSSTVRAPTWEDSVRHGSGPSVGPPPSDFTGASPPRQWCLRATARSTGDFSGPWAEVSQGWLRQILSDTADLGDGWRKVLGGAPRLTPADSIVQVTDESVCHDVAQMLNRELLGWSVGPPPIVIFRVRDYLIAYPSNARRGEFGMAVGMRLDRRIRAVSTW